MRSDALDLLALCRQLPPEHDGLKRMTEDLSAIHSAHSDLVIAADLAGRFVDLHAKPGSLPREFLEDAGIAFFCAALVYYARATKSRSKHRKSFDLRRYFDDAELEDHKLLCRLRDDAIAHYGPGRLSDATTLREDRMLLAGHPPKVFFASRSVVAGDFGHLIRRQAQRSLLCMQRLQQDHEVKVIGYMNDHASELLALPQWLAAGVNLESIVGKEIAEKLRSRPQIGRHRFSEG